MTYGIVAILLLILAVVWYVVTGRTDKRMDELEAAIEQGDEGRFSALLKASPEVVSNISDVTFLLLRCILLNRPSMVQEVLDLGHRGAELQECALEHEANLFATAIDCADTDVLRMLLAAGMKERVEECAPALYCYVVGKPEHLKVLHALDADDITEKQNPLKYTPLHVAAIRFAEHPESILAMIKPLLEAGADVNALTEGGNTPLDMALDRTHEGCGDTGALVELLLSYGARRGRSLRVPEPTYCGRLYYSIEHPELVLNDLPEGVEVQLHAEPDADLPDAQKMSEFAFSDAVVSKVQTHRSYAELCVKGRKGEDPLEVAARGLSVLTRLAAVPEAVGVRFADSVLLDPKQGELVMNGEYCPMLYTALKFAQTDDGLIVVNTSGLSGFGLPEIELVINRKELRKHKKTDLSDVVSDWSSVIVAGASAWEAGHTATICGMFCRIGYGRHGITENEGPVFVVGEV